MDFKLSESKSQNQDKILFPILIWHLETTHNIYGRIGEINIYLSKERLNLFHHNLI